MTSEQMHGAEGVCARGLVGVAGRVGTITPPLFYAVVLVLGQVTPNYNPVSRFASELSLGSLGWIMIANFIMLGAAVVVLSAGLWRATGSQLSGRAGAVLVGIAGLAFLDAGVFVTDRQNTPVTTHGVLHVLAALVLFFFAFPAASGALARRYRNLRRFCRYSLATAVLTPVLFIVTFLSGGFLGLSERILIGMDLAWLTVVGILLSRGSLRAPATQPR